MSEFKWTYACPRHTTIDQIFDCAAYLHTDRMHFLDLAQSNFCEVKAKTVGTAHAEAQRAVVNARGV